MDEQRLKILNAELDELTELVAHWEEKWNEKYNEIVALVGICAHCLDSHHPHCETQQS